VRPDFARRVFLAAATVAVAFGATFATPAFADKKTEAIAKAAIKKAKSDFAAQNYGSGTTRLQKVVKACGDTKCTAATRATLLMDLGAMQLKKGSKDEANASFIAAAKLQPGIAFDPAFDTPDVRAAFAAATNPSSGGGGGSAGGDTGGGTSAPSGGDSGGTAPSGDFGHTPPTEQAVDTPLPIYVDGGPDGVARVVVKYKPEGASSWKRIDLKHLDSGWAGLIPCADIKSGTLRYYIQGLDDSKTPVGSNGDAKHPYTVKIKDTISGDAPHLPGKDPPKSCSESSDCPPDFPGCSKSGDSAGDNGDDNGDESKDDDSKPKGPFKRWWVGIGADFEFVSMPSNKNDVCALSPTTALPLNSDNLYCTDQAGNDFPSRATGAQNNQLCTAAAAAAGECVGDAGGQSAGGFVRGDIRLMAAVDYAATANLLVGGRLGVTFFDYQGTAASKDGRASSLGRFYGEARGSWVFGSNALATTGIKPVAVVGAGVGEFDAHVTSAVAYCNYPLVPNVKCPGYAQGTVDVWKTAGPVFAALGGGVRWAVTDSIALSGILRLNLAFGSGGLLPTFGPELTAQYGF
jgi:hypothetical protein